MARKTNEQAQETRRKILAGALNVFSEKGFSRSTLGDIAKRIGMTRGAVYWHFKDKREILVELIEDMHQREAELLADKVPALNSLEDLMVQFLSRADLLEHDKEFRKFVRFMSMQVEWATEERIFNLLRDGHMRNAPFEDFKKVLKQAQERDEIRPDVDLGQTFDILVGLFTGMVRHYLSGMASTPLQPTLRVAVQMIFDSIRA